MPTAISMHRRRQDHRDRDQGHLRHGPLRAPPRGLRASAGCRRRCSRAHRRAARRAPRPGAAPRRSCRASGLLLRARSASNASRRVAPRSIWRSVVRISSAAGPLSDVATRSSAAAVADVPARTVIARMSMKSGMSRSSRAWRMRPVRDSHTSTPNQPQQRAQQRGEPRAERQEQDREHDPEREQRRPAARHSARGSSRRGVPARSSRRALESVAHRLIRASNARAEPRAEQVDQLPRRTRARRVGRGDLAASSRRSSAEAPRISASPRTPTAQQHAAARPVSGGIDHTSILVIRRIAIDAERVQGAGHDQRRDPDRAAGHPRQRVRVDRVEQHEGADAEHGTM